jgi:predicted CXXCH cytochrome family protein
MAAKRNSSLLAVFIVLACLLLCSISSFAQCNLSQGCGPVDNLTHQTNGTGQVYNGDGASNNGSGGWTTNSSGATQCFSCHNGTDTETYLKSGHKNTLRKLAPSTIWGGPDGVPYLTTDDHYGSGSVYNWTTNTVTLGWCDPLSVPAQNGLPAKDPTCSYPYYTLPDSHSPTPYSTVAPTAAAGGEQNLFYLLGGWDNYGGTSNNAETHLGSIFSNGFTGGLYPNGNFDCARCHATGYNFNASGPEPTQNTNNVLAAIPNSQFSRIPSDGYIAPGTTGTSSWYLTGVQCERCHEAAWSYGSHGSGPWQATMPQNEAATALCLECHRGEIVTTANASTVPPTPASITPQATPKTQDHGYCSDLSGSAYSTCVANSANTWVYKPYFEHEAGPTFLNSPHARFTGGLVQNAQHSPDLSITVSGSYQSLFSGSPTDPSKNNGCVGCHDPHQSATPSANLPQPYVCNDCHNLSSTLVQTINHPTGPGTPFPTGTSADIPGACVNCHMVAADGNVKSHLFRISWSDYSNFPTPAQLYGQNITAPNVSSDGVSANAAWNDVDLACGQCHMGGSGNGVNPYGLTAPPQTAGRAPILNKAALEVLASTMHSGDTSAPTPTFTPAAGTFTTAQSVTLAEATPGLTIYYNTDGSTPPNSASSIYSGAAIPVSSNTTINAIALGVGGWASSLVGGATYTIQTPAPTLLPAPGTFTTPQSVTLSDATSAATIYYTTNGSTPTTASTQYTAAIPLSTQTTIRAIAVGANGTSAITTGTYTFSFPPASSPTFSPSPGTYTGAQTVTFSDKTPGVTIYYTTNGSTPTTASTQYTGPITISTNTPISAFAVGVGYTPSQVSSGSYVINFATAATPAISPTPYTYTTPQTVTLSDKTPGVTIYYTTNGSAPTTASSQYTGPFTVSTTTTVEAIAAGGGYLTSTTASGTYTINAAAPGISPTPYTYTTPQTVTLSDKTPGVTIYYTTNGTAPTTASTQYTGPFTVSTTTTVEAIAAGGGYGASNVTSGTYTINAAAPAISPTPYTYSAPQTVTLSDTTPGASIYYTTNGTAPTTASTQYTGPFTVSTTTTVEAIAAGGGYGASNVTSGTYTITGSAPALATSISGTAPLSITSSTTDTNAAGNGYAQSPVASGTYTLLASTPGFSPAPRGTFNTVQSVTLIDATPGANIYYTTNGTTPTTASTLYTGPIPVSTTTTIKAIAAGHDFGPSAVASGTYTLVAATPVFSPAPRGTFTLPLSVTMTDATPDVTIYYTANGTTPTTASTPYTKPIRVTGSMTIKAIAVGNGYGASAVAGGSYAPPLRPSQPRKRGRPEAPKVATLTDAPQSK